MQSIAGHVDIVELLINNGANVNRQDPKGQTPLHFAVKSGNLNMQMYTFICAWKKAWQLTNWFVNTGNEKSVKLLMQSGAIVNTRDNNGDEPFQVVLNRGNGMNISLTYHVHNYVQRDRYLNCNLMPISFRLWKYR